MYICYSKWAYKVGKYLNRKINDFNRSAARCWHTSWLKTNMFRIMTRRMRIMYNQKCWRNSINAIIKKPKWFPRIRWNRARNCANIKTLMSYDNWNWIVPGWVHIKNELKYTLMQLHEHGLQNACTAKEAVRCCIVLNQARTPNTYSSNCNGNVLIIMLVFAFHKQFHLNQMCSGIWSKRIQMTAFASTDKNWFKWGKGEKWQWFALISSRWIKCIWN